MRMAREHVHEIVGAIPRGAGILLAMLVIATPFAMIAVVVDAFAR